MKTPAATRTWFAWNIAALPAIGPLKIPAALKMSAASVILADPLYPSFPVAVETWFAWVTEAVPVTGLVTVPAADAVWFAWVVAEVPL